MGGSITLICPQIGCRCEFPLFDLPEPEYEFQGRENVYVRTICPRCRGEVPVFSGAGTFAAVGGRLRRVATALLSADIEEIVLLRREIEAARAQLQRERAQALLQEHDGLRSLLLLWRPTTHEEFWALIDRVYEALLLVITLAAGATQADDVAGAVAEQLRPPPSQGPVSEPGGTG